MPLRPCLELGCPELVRRGRCPEHARAQRGRRRARAVYDDPRWQVTRAIAIARAGGRCQAIETANGPRCPVTTGLHGHHDYEGGVEQMLVDGADPFDADWVVVLCDHHHGRLEAWLRAQKRRIRR